MDAGNHQLLVWKTLQHIRLFYIWPSKNVFYQFSAKIRCYLFLTSLNPRASPSSEVLAYHVPECPRSRVPESPRPHVPTSFTSQRPHVPESLRPQVARPTSPSHLHNICWTLCHAMFNYDERKTTHFNENRNKRYCFQYVASTFSTIKIEHPPYSQNLMPSLFAVSGHYKPFS